MIIPANSESYCDHNIRTNNPNMVFLLFLPHHSALQLCTHSSNTQHSTPGTNPRLNIDRGITNYPGNKAVRPKNQKGCGVPQVLDCAAGGMDLGWKRRDQHCSRHHCNMCDKAKHAQRPSSPLPNTFSPSPPNCGGRGN